MDFIYVEEEQAISLLDNNFVPSSLVSPCCQNTLSYIAFITVGLYARLIISFPIYATYSLPTLGLCENKGGLEINEPIFY